MPPTAKFCVDDMFMEPANHLLNCYTRNLRKKNGLTDELFYVVACCERSKAISRAVSFCRPWPISLRCKR
jgi:hypothetical protein